MISIFALAALAAAQPAMQPPPQPQPPLNLTCVGAGNANKTKYRTIQVEERVRDKDGKPTGEKKWTSKTISENVTQDFADQVDVVLFSGDDQIRVPRVMLPDLHGGKAGWFKLKNVTGDARAIDASVGLAFLNNPKIHIDRVTGIITISGKAGDYSGQCQAVAADAVARF